MNKNAKENNKKPALLKMEKVPLFKNLNEENWRQQTDENIRILLHKVDEMNLEIASFHFRIKEIEGCYLEATDKLNELIITFNAVAPALKLLSGASKKMQKPQS